MYKIGVLFQQFFPRSFNSRILGVIDESFILFQRALSKIVYERIGIISPRVIFLVSQIIIMLRNFVRRNVFHIEAVQIVAEQIVSIAVVIYKFPANLFHEVTKQSVVAVVKTIFVVKSVEAFKNKSVQKFFDEEKRKGEQAFVLIAYAQMLTEFLQIGVGTGYTLQIKENGNERRIVHGRGVTVELKSEIEQIVFLITKSKLDTR